MQEPLAYLNGQWIPFSQLHVPVTDGGFMLGATVAEQIRTFGGRLFRLSQHLDRLERSLEIVQVDPGVSREQFAAVAEKLASTNHALLPQGSDLGLCLFVTPGPYGAFATAEAEPIVAAHTYPLPFFSWADKYDHGQKLAISSHRQVPSVCWPAELKCRSRMHYYLADREANQKQPGARALLLDAEGRITEASTANLLAYFSHGRAERSGDSGSAVLVSPPWESVLPGVSVAMVHELAESLSIPLVFRELWPHDLNAADEVFLTSTSPCIMPVSEIDGRPIGGGRPGPMFTRLISAWSEAVGVDVVAQTKRFGNRPETVNDFAR